MLQFIPKRFNSGSYLFTKIHFKIGCNDVCWTNSAQVRGPVTGWCEYGNYPLGFIKGGEFLTR